MRSKAKIVSLSALFAALIMVATAYIKVPITVGYVHLGDIFIVMAAFVLPAPIAVGVAAIGSMLADLIAGYVVYMPVTFVAKGVMALVFSLFYYKKFRPLRVIVGSLTGSLIMVACYFVFEIFYYGMPVAVANLPLQLIQPAIAVPVGSVITFALSKIGYINGLKEEIAFKKKIKNESESLKNDKNQPDREP